MKPRIVWYATARSPYNDFLFSELAKHANLKVYIRHVHLPSHPWTLARLPCECRIVRGNLVRAIRDAWRADLVVLVGWDSVVYLTITLLLSPWVRKVFWTDTPDPRPRGVVHYLIRSVIVRLVFWRFDEVWATGVAGCRAVQQLGCPERKSVSFPFFVDNEGISCSRDEEAITGFRMQQGSSDKWVLICVGRLIASKRFDDAIRTLGVLDDHFVLWIAGDGEERAKLEVLASKLGVARRVHFLGWLQPDATALAVDASDVFLHPAELDPFPTVVLDAMARGKPIVGTKTSGSVEDRVRDGINGYIVRPGDYRMIARHVEEICSSVESLRQFGARARATAEEYPVSLAMKMIFNAMSGVKNVRCSWSRCEEFAAIPVRTHKDEVR